MKNVTGYDLVKLMAGSRGTLGVLSEVSLKVQAVPEAEATLVGEGLSAQAAIGALSAALGSPFDVSGAAFVSDGGKAMIRLEGLAESVSYRVRQLQAGACANWTVIEAAESVATWKDVRDVQTLTAQKDAVWRISVKPSDAPAVLERLRNPPAVCDWGGGLVWAAISEATDVRAALAGIGGHATLIKGSVDLLARVPVFQPEPAPLATITQGLRAKFDPRGILNSGVMA